MDTSRARHYYNSGYHVYQDIWEPTNGEILPCFREEENGFDCFAVCIKKDAEIVGHVPRTISPICAMFLWNNGTIQCEVTGPRRYSRGIPQSGMEIPCHFYLKGPNIMLAWHQKSLRKVEKLRIRQKWSRSNYQSCGFPGWLCRNWNRSSKQSGGSHAKKQASQSCSGGWQEWKGWQWERSRSKWSMG